MKIVADNKCVSYMGRIDFSRADQPLFIYAGSMVKAKFTGTKIAVIIKNQPMGEYSSLGAVIDGIQYKLDLVQDNEEHSYAVAENLSEGVHTLTVFKRQAAAHYFRFCGVELDQGAEIMPADESYKLKLEVFGDSVSAGEVTEAVYYTEHIDPDDHKGVYDNSWFSYPLMTARKLSAYIHNNSQGGIALFDKTGYFCGPETETMLGVESTYDKLSYVPYSAEGMTDWDFSRYTPDVLVFAIGQNDQNPAPAAIHDPDYAKKWRGKYKDIITDLQSKYKGVKVVLILTVLMHDEIWDRQLDLIVEELADENVRHLRFKRCGKATPGHPRIPEQEEMAEELSEFIKGWTEI